MLSQAEEGVIQQKVREAAGKFVAMKMAIFQARADIDWMLRRAPENLRQELGHLQKRQGQLEQRFFDIEGRLISLAHDMGYAIPGLSSLGENAVTLLASTAKLYWDATNHVSKVAEFKAKFVPSGGIPEMPSPGTMPKNWKTYALIGLAALFFLRR